MDDLLLCPIFGGPRTRRLQKRNHVPVCGEPDQGAKPGPAVCFGSDRLSACKGTRLRTVKFVVARRPVGIIVVEKSPYYGVSTPLHLLNNKIKLFMREGYVGGFDGKIWNEISEASWVRRVGHGCPAFQIPADAADQLFGPRPRVFLGVFEQGIEPVMIWRLANVQVVLEGATRKPLTTACA